MPLPEEAEACHINLWSCHGFYCELYKILLWVQWLELVTEYF